MLKKERNNKTKLKKALPKTKTQSPSIFVKKIKFIEKVKKSSDKN